MKTQTQLIAPHIGNLLKAYYKANQINKAGLARAINRSRASVQDYEKRKSLQCHVLWEVCIAMEHNFFAEIAAQLPQTYLTNLPEETTQTQRIAQLEKENNALTVQLSLLKGILGS